MAARNLKVHRNYPRAGCPHCGFAPRLQGFRPGANVCAFCQKQFEAMTFAPPPEFIFVKPAGAEAFDAEAAGRAPCAKHELNAAVGSCQRCGNFVCPLCLIALGGKDYCAACFERVLQDGDETVRPAEEMYYGGIASVTSLCGMLPPLGLLLGPAAVYFGIKGVKQAQAARMPFNAKFNAAFSILMGALETVANWGGLGYAVVMLVEKNKW